MHYCRTAFVAYNLIFGIITMIAMGVPSLYFYFYFSDLSDHSYYTTQTCLITSATLFSTSDNRNLYTYQGVTDNKLEPQNFVTCTVGTHQPNFIIFDTSLLQYGYQFKNNIMLWACGHQENNLPIGMSFNCSIREMPNHVNMALLDLGSTVNERDDWRIPYIDWMGWEILTSLSLSLMAIFIFSSVLMGKRKPVDIVMEGGGQEHLVAWILYQQDRYIMLTLLTDVLGGIIVGLSLWETQEPVTENGVWFSLVCLQILLFIFKFIYWGFYYIRQPAGTFLICFMVQILIILCVLYLICAVQTRNIFLAIPIYCHGYWMIMYWKFGMLDK